MAEFVLEGLTAEADIPAEIKCAKKSDGAKAFYTFTVTWQKEDMVGSPFFRISFRKKIIDIQYQWHSGCGAARDIRPDWGCRVTSKISSGCPLHCFMNDAGRNRLSVALDDCVTQIDRRIGVREEDGTLDARIAIALDNTGKTTEYTVTLLLDESDVRYEDAIRAVAAWWEEKYPPMAAPAAAKDPLYSFWYSYHQQVFAPEVEAECARAAQAGFKTVIVDDGWQTDDGNRGYGYCGDWQPTAKKFPDMRAHIAKAHGMGLKYMLWYSVPFIGKYSEAAKTFKGKTLDYLDSMNAFTLDPRYPEVRQYLVGIYEKALREWDLDGFKLDFIDSFRMAKDTPLFAEGMDTPVLEEAVHRLMVSVRDTLTAIKPDILIEFRQSYIGPVMREFGNMLRVSDCPSTTNINRIGMVDLRLTSGETAVHSDMLMWHAEDRLENAVCQIENVLFTTLQLSVRLDRVPGEQMRAIRFWVDFMAKNRHILQEVPITAECPQMLYPVVRAQEGHRTVIACYEANYVANIPAGVTDVTLVSAHEGTEQIVRFAVGGVWHGVVRDAAGNVVREGSAWASGLTILRVPECGLIEMKKC